MQKAEYPVKFFTSQKDFEKWLSKNYEKSGIWLKFAKKKSGIVSLSYDEALDIALCYGWIDSQAKSLDEKYYLQKFTPRGSKSNWSKINTEHIARLTKEGKMQPFGIAAVNAAKKDGRWERAYSSSQTMSVPEDFLNLLSKNKNAEAFFKTLSKTNVYAIAFRIATAKKDETKKRRMEQIIAMLERGEKFH